MKKIVFACLCMLLMASCKQNKTQNTTTDTAVVKKEIGALEDSVKTAWKVMIESDDNKISDMKRLLQEFEVVKNHNATLRSSLVSQQMTLASKRYNEQTMQASDKIDAYDQATDSLMRGLSELIETTPDIENYPLCKELMRDIQLADNEVFSYRVKYDHFARQYNAFLKNNEAQLEELGYNIDQAKPLFELAPE